MATHDMMRSANLLSVFNTVRKHGTVTKKEIQQLTGLSWGSASNITGDLLERGILQETGDVAAQVGRTPKGLEINPNKNLIVGVDINLQGVTGVVIDMRGQTTAVIEEPICSTSRQILMEQSKQIIRRLLAGVPDRREAKGIGVSFPGHVDSATGTSVRIQHFDGFDGYPIGCDLREEFGIDVLLDHDTNCIAIAEHMLGAAQETDNFLLIRLCRGIGMATVYGGEVFRGRNGATGEIGHMVVQPGGPKCQCGNSGCLESYASARSIVSQCADGMALGLSDALSKTSAGKEEPDLADIMAAAEGGDAFCASILGQAAAYTGIAISNVVNILDPERVVLCGELTAYQSYLDRVIEQVQRNIWRREKVDFRVAQNHGVSAAVGVAALFIEQIFLRVVDPAETTDE